MAPRRCPCGSGLPLGECCGRLHDGTATAATAEQLMRSRYSAFVLGDAAYLLATWHPSTRPRSLELDDAVRWTGLDVLGHDRRLAAGRRGNRGVPGVLRRRPPGRRAAREQPVRPRRRAVALPGRRVPGLTVGAIRRRARIRPRATPRPRRPPPRGRRPRRHRLRGRPRLRHRRAGHPAVRPGLRGRDDGRRPRRQRVRLLPVRVGLQRRHAGRALRRAGRAGRRAARSSPSPPGWPGWPARSRVFLGSARGRRRGQRDVHRGRALAAAAGRAAVAPRPRGRATWQGGFILGGIAGPAVGGLLAELSPRLPFFLYAGFLLVAGAVALVLLRTAPRRPSGEAPVAAGAGPRGRPGARCAPRCAPGLHGGPGGQPRRGLGALRRPQLAGAALRDRGTRPHGRLGRRRACWSARWRRPSGCCGRAGWSTAGDAAPR